MTIAEKIINGVYDDEVIEEIRKINKDILFDKINNIVNDEEKADEILKTALDKAGVKYTICEKTGRIITYLEVNRYVTLYSSMNLNGEESDYDDEYEDDSEYYCPHCGRHIEEIFNDDEAIEIIRGERDEYGNPR
jgi:hypothetical protein